ncbi:MAG: hypothetical protein AAGA73_04425 [Pseudomonadota bacterium]
MSTKNFEIINIDNQQRPQACRHAFALDRWQQLRDGLFPKTHKHDANNLSIGTVADPRSYRGSE